MGDRLMDAKIAGADAAADRMDKAVKSLRKRDAEAPMGNRRISADGILAC